MSYGFFTVSLCRVESVYVVRNILQKMIVLEMEYALYRLWERDGAEGGENLYTFFKIFFPLVGRYDRY